MEYRLSHPHNWHTGDLKKIASSMIFFKKMQQNQNKDRTISESFTDQTLSDANCCSNSHHFLNLTRNSLILQYLYAALEDFF